jgi:hypothetical protein
MEENRLIKIEDLQIGDEILTPSLNTFKRLKIIRLPSKNKYSIWKSTKCSIRNDNVNNNSNNYARYNCRNDKDFNDTIMINLSWRDLWLVKRI